MIYFKDILVSRRRLYLRDSFIGFTEFKSEYGLDSNSVLHFIAFWSFTDSADCTFSHWVSKNSNHLATKFRNLS